MDIPQGARKLAYEKALSALMKSDDQREIKMEVVGEILKEYVMFSWE